MKITILSMKIYPLTVNIFKTRIAFGYNFIYFRDDLKIISIFYRHLEKNKKLERSKEISIICFNATIIPVVIKQRAKIFLDNLNSLDPVQNIRQLYSNVSSAKLPKSWGLIDTKTSL